MKIFLIILIILFVLLLIYSIIENVFILKVTRYGSGSIRAVQISDLHRRRFGKNNQKLIDAVIKEKPDVIFVTGDLISRKQRDISGAGRLLNELCKISPVYIIYGNHEQCIEYGNEEKLLQMILDTDAVLLRNERKHITLNHRELNIIGLEPSPTIYKNGKGYKNLDVVDIAEMKRLLGYPPEGFNVLLSHNPFFAEAYAEWGADLTFCGHVHGGSVRIFGKGLLSPERKFFPKYDKGVYTVGKMTQVVSAGLGKPRLFDPPEIVVYEF